jgi:hypothetical protein
VSFVDLRMGAGRRFASGLRWPNIEQRIHERPHLARFAVTHLAIRRECPLDSFYRRLDITDCESALSRDAQSAQGALFEQQLRQNGCFVWWRRLRHSHQKRNRLIGVLSLRKNLEAKSGKSLWPANICLRNVALCIPSVPPRCSPSSRPFQGASSACRARVASSILTARVCLKRRANSWQPDMLCTGYFAVRCAAHLSSWRSCGRSGS